MPSGYRKNRYPRKGLAKGVWFTVGKFSIHFYEEKPNLTFTTSTALFQALKPNGDRSRTSTARPRVKAPITLKTDGFWLKKHGIICGYMLWGWEPH